MPLGTISPATSFSSEAIAATHDLLSQAVRDGSVMSGYLAGRHQGGVYVERLAAKFNRSNACHQDTRSIPVNSATSGILAACMAAGVGFGSEVIVSPLTMSGTAAPAAILGARIVFADVEKHTLCMDPDRVAELFTENTKAVIATDLFGHVADTKRLRSICDNHGVTLIEDAAQAYGSLDRYGNRSGAYSHIAVFSFNVHKQLQVGEGGMVVVNDPKLYTKVYDAINHGEVAGGIMGLNLRMNELTAAVMHEQLDRDRVWENARYCASVLDRMLKQCPSFEIPERVDDRWASYVWWAYLTGPLNENWLNEHNIATPYSRRGDKNILRLNRGYTYLPGIQAFAKYDQNTTPFALDAASRIVTIELCTQMISLEQAEYIGRVLAAP